MVTNVTINTVDAQAVVYFQDGTTAIASSQSEESFQLVDTGFVTVSDAPIDVDAPQVDNTLPTPMAQKFIEAWRKVVDGIREEIDEDMNQPEVNPL